ncbi:MAG: hypothetical protein JSS32_09880 [Verrucomicrobia bacterium]|nr:hypothetical protein [Verrucomicrobiota bacterium]
MSISSSSFSFASLNQDAYKFQVQFSDAAGKPVSEKSFVFTQTQSPSEDTETLDVYSQNGVCRSNVLKHLFSQEDVLGVQNVAKKAIQANGPVVYVLDLKGINKGYLDPTIPKCEEAVCDFFKSEEADDAWTGAAQDVHKVFQKNLPVDFVLCEGSLKTKLVSEFSDEEAGFLLSKKGVTAFCQVAEPFMNGFKLGQEVKGIAAKDYMAPVSKKVEVFHPTQKSTVLYPDAYKEIYSLNGAYAKSLSGVFSVSGDFDEETGITSMTVER